MQFLDYLYNVLFDLSELDIASILQKTVVFLFIWGLVFYLVYFLLTKLLFANNAGLQRDQLLKLNQLRAVIATVVIFCVYLFFLIKFNGLDKFQWGEPSFYLSILPQLLTIIGLVVLFNINYQSFIKKLKTTR